MLLFVTLYLAIQMYVCMIHKVWYTVLQYNLLFTTNFYITCIRQVITKLLGPFFGKGLPNRPPVSIDHATMDFGDPGLNSGPHATVRVTISNVWQHNFQTITQALVPEWMIFSNVTAGLGLWLVLNHSYLLSRCFRLTLYYRPRSIRYQGRLPV